MTQTAQHAADIATLEKLNADYIQSDQFNDVARYEQMLASDFLVQLPDLVTRDRQAFLDMIAQPRPFNDLTAHDVNIRVLGDIALIQPAAPGSMSSARWLRPAPS